MALGETNRVRLVRSRESTWGETPSGPNATIFRYKSDGLVHNKQTVVTEEIRDDRMRPDILEVGQDANGPTAHELSYGNFEDVLESLVRNSISSTTVAAASVTMAASAITGPSGTDFTVFEVGQWVQVEASGYNNDRGVAQVTARTSTTISLRGSTFTASVLASANIHGRTLKNGTTVHSYFIEANHVDLTAVRYFTGMEVAGGGMNINSGQIVELTLDWMGKRGFAASVTQASALTSANSNTPLTAAVNVGDIYENGVKLTDSLQAVSFNVNNNMRARPQVGSKTGAQPGDGGIDVTGQVNMYFGRIHHLLKQINHTETELAVTMKDADGNRIVVTFPSVYYSAGNPPATGQDADVFLPIDFVARRDPTEGIAIRMDFLPGS